MFGEKIDGTIWEFVILFILIMLGIYALVIAIEAGVAAYRSEPGERWSAVKEFIFYKGVITDDDLVSPLYLLGSLVLTAFIMSVAAGCSHLTDKF